jgi:hypothetical protein
MNTSDDLKINLPVKGGLTLIYVASLLVALLMTVASVAGLRYRALIYPTDELVRTFVSNDVVNLLIGLPILLGSMYLAWRGKWIGLFCWTGALFFVFYNYTAYVFALPLNWAFPFHLILMTLSAYALVALVALIDGKTVQQRLSSAVPERFAGGVLAGLGVLFLLRVVGVMVGALASGNLPSEPEFAVNIADFLTTPAWVVGGILLWQRKELGYVSGLGLLFQGSMLFAALIIFLLLQPLLTGAPLAVMDVVVIFVMGLVCFIPFALFVRGVIASRKTG